MADQVEKRREVRHLDMAIGRNAGLAHGNATDARDLFVDLLPGQNAALSGLGALGELELEHLDLRVGGDLAQLVVAQTAGRVADPVFRRPDLENEVATAFQVIGAEPALPGVQPDARLGRALAEGAYGGARNRAVGHARDVEERRRIVGLARVGPDAQGLGRRELVVERREAVIDEDGGPRDREVAGGTEGDRVPLPLGRAVDPVALRPVERHLLAVHGKEILAEELAQLGKPAPEPAKDRVVAADRVGRLAAVDDEKHQRRGRDQTDHEHEKQREPLQRGGGEIHDGHAGLRCRCRARVPQQTPAASPPLSGS